VSSWTWANASVVGTSHIKVGARKQDAVRCFSSSEDKSFLVSIVSDGAGSAPFGGEGASLSCWLIGNAVSHHLDRIKTLPTEEDFLAWVDCVRDALFVAASKRNCSVRDFAATFLLCVSNGMSTFTAQIGDGCIVLRDDEQKKWFVPNWPDHGEYASTTYFITDEVKVKYSVSRLDTPIQGVVMFSDGLERLALDFSNHEPHSGFFDGVYQPVLSSGEIGKDLILSKALSTFLANDNICSRTDDDKTLVVAVCK